MPIEKVAPEAVDHPEHYNSHPSGIECIDVARHYSFSIGNAIKYLWRAGLKHNTTKSEIDVEIEDLRKAQWYIQDRIDELQKSTNVDSGEQSTPAHTSTGVVTVVGYPPHWVTNQP